MTADYRLLDGLSVAAGGVPLALGHARQRALLAVLLIEANRKVSTAQLIEWAWGDHLPRQAHNTLYSYLSRLRRALAGAGDVALTRASGGYVLRLDESTVDLHRFRTMVQQAREHTDDNRAVTGYEAALALWRGQALSGLDTPWFADVRRDLEKERYAAELDHADRALAAGRHAELVPELSRRAAAHPLDERIAGQLIRALNGSGRRADALSHYDQIRVRLGEELGVDPGTPLRELHQRILRDEPYPTGGHPPPRQLPGLPRTFVGRAAELAALTAALAPATGAGTPIAAITGIGGIGKTWLALRWAEEHRDRFPDGQVFVNLRGFTPAGQPLPAAAAVRGFLDALGVPPAAVPPDPDAQLGLYRSLVADRRMLFLLDNARDSDQVEDLLPGTSAGAVIVTSRDRLAGLVGQQDAHPVPLDVLDDAAAHRLLARRLGDDRLVKEKTAVAALVAGCAGLPLALAIAAARTAAQPGNQLAAIAAELSGSSTRLSALDEGLRTVLDGSYQALTAAQARLFTLLGAAPGPDIGLTSAAALSGCGAAEVAALERQSLLTQQSPGRWRMHDLVRLYAQERAGADQADALRSLLHFWVHTAWTAARVLAPHRPPIPLDPDTLAATPEALPDPASATAWFDREYAGLLAGQQLALDAGWYPAVWQLAWSLHTYQHRNGLLTDKVRVWQVALTAAGRAGDPTARIGAHRQLGRAYSDLSRYADAIDELERALELADEAGDPASRAETRLTLGQAYNVLGDDERALDYSTAALRIYAGLDNPVRHAVALNAVGWHAARLGRYAEARDHLDEALALQRRHHDRTYLADTLDSRGFLALRTGDHVAALDYLTEALAVFRELGDAYGEADAVTHLGDTHAARLERDRAEQDWRTALRLFEAQHRMKEAYEVRARLGASPLRRTERQAGHEVPL